MAEEKQAIQIQAELLIFSLTGVNIGFSEEDFEFLMTSGNQVRRYHSSPKHAKRILLLLQQSIKEYEDRFGELQTQLPQAKGISSVEDKIGFQRK